MDKQCPATTAKLDAVFDCLAHGDRRRILRHLLEGDAGPVSQRALSSALLGEEPTGSGRTRQQLRTAIRHTHGPKLAAAGLVERGDDAVWLADHPAFEDAGIVEALTTAPTAEAAPRDELFGSLADGRRRLVLDVLSHQFQAIHTETLARELGAIEEGLPEAEVPTETGERLLVELAHVQLPRLADAGLVDYDRDAGTVAYEGHPELRVPWMHSVLAPAFRASLTGESEPQEMGTIEGREQVISYGQSLGDYADEELFCMFTHKDMLEAGCFRRIIQATNRGVKVFLGTYDPTIREFVREHAPQVTLWEPKTDWLNLPVEGNRVGRLLLADRDRLMLGTLKEEDGDAIPEETAIIGEGTDNALVVMVRQMLSAHLEKIDEDTPDDVERKLSF